MLHIQNFLTGIVCKTMMVVVFIIVSCSVVFADSVVYLFVPSRAVPIPVKINNQEVFRMDGTLKGNKYATYYSACQKKCVLKSEGKVIISMDFSFKTSDFSPSAAATVGDVTRHWANEIQLNLSENSVHYVKITSKGLNDVQFKEITEKEAQKLLKNKKYVRLPDYIEE